MSAFTSTRNVILVGETGSGKTSIINMIAGRVVAPFSEATGTRFCSVYPIPMGELVYNLYDTPGLDSGTLELGTDKVTEFITSNIQDGVNLLVFCMRGRITEDAVAIYKHFSDLVKVPVIAVITGLENEDPMESWWTKNRAAFDGYRMSFVGHACVTTILGKGSIFAIQYKESMNTVRDLIATHCLRNGQRAVFHKRQEDPDQIPTIEQRRRRVYIISLTTLVVVVVVIVIVAVAVPKHRN